MVSCALPEGENDWGTTFYRSYEETVTLAPQFNSCLFFRLGGAKAGLIELWSTITLTVDIDAVDAGCIFSEADAECIFSKVEAVLGGGNLDVLRLLIDCSSLLSLLVLLNRFLLRLRYFSISFEVLSILLRASYLRLSLLRTSSVIRCFSLGSGRMLKWDYFFFFLLFRKWNTTNLSTAPILIIVLFKVHPNYSVARPLSNWCVTRSAQC